MTDDELADSLMDHNFVLRTCIEISHSVDPDRGSDIQKRNAELTYLSAGIVITAKRLNGVTLNGNMATIIKESIINAYYLGKRDAKIPDAFEDFDKED